MTSSSGNKDMKANQGQWDAAAFDAAIAGAPGAEPMLEAFVSAVRNAADRPIDGAVQARHVAAAAAAVRPAAGPVAAVEPAPSLAVRWRRRLSLAGLTSGLAVKMMIGTAALAAVGGGAAAATGTLPAPIQSVVAGAVGYVGIDLPDPGATSAITVAIEDGEEATENPAADNKAHAEEQKVRAAAYKAAVREWNDCVHTAARNNPRGVAFDPATACPDHPRPDEFGLPGRRVGADKDKETGPPDHSNAPDKAGPKDDDKPDKPGKPDDPGKPDQPKPPKDKDSKGKDK